MLACRPRRATWRIRAVAVDGPILGHGRRSAAAGDRARPLLSLSAGTLLSGGYRPPVGEASDHRQHGGVRRLARRPILFISAGRGLGTQTRGSRGPSRPQDPLNFPGRLPPLAGRLSRFVRPSWWSSLVALGVDEASQDTMSHFSDAAHEENAGEVQSLSIGGRNSTHRRANLAPSSHDDRFCHDTGMMLFCPTNCAGEIRTTTPTAGQGAAHPRPVCSADGRVVSPRGGPSGWLSSGWPGGGGRGSPQLPVAWPSPPSSARNPFPAADIDACCGCPAWRWALYCRARHRRRSGRGAAHLGMDGMISSRG